MNTDCKLPASALRDQQNRGRVGRAASFDSILTEDELLPEEELIQIVVKRTGGSEAPCLELSIEKSATVLNLKTLIQDELADESPCLMVPVQRQRLLFSGKMLTDNELKLVDDIKMKPDKLNYIHLAPLPKNIAPSARTPMENKCQRTLRRPPKSRSTRANHPYGNFLTTRRQSSENVPPRAYVPPSTNTMCSSADMATQMAPQSLFRPLELMLNNQAPMMDETILNESNDLMPLCRVIRSNVSQIINGANHDERAMLATEQTILLLDQLSSRSTSLARSLRVNLREQRHRQLLSAQELLEDGLPWGTYQY